MLADQLGAVTAQFSALGIALLIVYGALLWVPGIAVGALLGLRGWVLLALAPLLTYGLAAICGPWMAGLGIAWTPLTTGAALLVVLIVVALLGWFTRRWAARRSTRTCTAGRTALPAWTVGGHVGVGAAVATAALLGGTVIVLATQGLTGIQQDWDALLHANGMRYIAETGNSSVSGMYTVNTFASGAALYYPHAYHLMGALAFEVTGATIPQILNAQTALMPLMLALSLVALVRTFRGRVALAVFAALVAPMATAMPYDLLWRGPLLPFATGLALVFGFVAALRIYLDRRSVPAALPVILAGAGLLGLHPSMVFTAALFAVPVLAARWWQAPRRVGAELGLLAAPAVVGAVAVWPHLSGALSQAPGVMNFTWPQDRAPSHALGEVVSFSTGHPHPQLWLLAFLVIGALGLRTLGELRWVPVAAAICAGLFVLSAAYSHPWAHKATSLWWNDKWRLAAIATLALLPLVAHGLVRSYDALLGKLLIPALQRVRAVDRPRAWTAPVAVAAVAVFFFLLTDRGYAERNIARTGVHYGFGSTVTPSERTAFDVLAQLVGPGERVMNDRFDGTGWMYALAGVQPVAAHFGRGGIGHGPELLAEGFDRYDYNPEIQAEVARLNIRWVIVGEKYIRHHGMQRQGGLVHVDQVDALDLVYDEGGVQIYKLARPVEPVPAEPASVRLEGG